jgi:hypothetical protein
MTHSATIAFKSLVTSRPAFPRRWMPAMLSALALVAGGHAAWAAPTTTSLFTTPDNPSSGAVITMTAQVSSTSFTVAGGTVTFTDTYNGVKETLGTVQVQSTNGAAGTAILKTEVGGVGAHQFVANFSGTQTFTASTSSVAAVTFAAPYLTTTSLTSAGTGPYALTGMVSAFGPSAPTGNVSFTDTTTGYNIGTVALNTATLQTGFAPYQSYAIANLNNGSTGGTVAPAIGDFNNDGRPDYAVPSNSGPIVILLGSGNGTFTTGTQLNTTLFTPTSVVANDFNGDGKQDIAVLSATGSVNIYLGNGDGTFGNPKNYAVAPALSGPASRILAAGDFNRDGIVDLVATNSALNNVAVLQGVGDGSFLAANYYSVATSSTSAGGKPWNVAVADINLDGFLDLVTASDGSSAVSILTGKGDGTFNSFITVNTPGSQVGSVGLGDFNGDNVPDLVTSSAPNQNIFILTNTTTVAGATPTFKAGTSYPMSNGPYYLTIGDFNRDGKLDIIAANNGAAVTGPPAVPAATAIGILLGNGSGGFGAATYYQVGGGSYFANAADINGDDQIDLTAVTTTGVSVLLSGESESTTLSNVTYQGCNTQAVVATYNGDGTYGSSTSASMNVTPTTLTTTLSLVPSPANGVVGQQYMFVATLSPYNSGTYSTNGEIVTFYANGYAFGTAPLVNGVATLNYTPTGTGSYTVYASYTKGCTTTGGFASATSTSTPVNVLKDSTLTWATPAAITYGTALNGMQLNATESVAGTFVYTPAAGTILTAGTQTLSVTFTPTDNTYGQKTATVNITVNPAAAVITWPTPTPITYGTALSALQLDAMATTGVVPVPLSSYYNVTGIYPVGTSYNTGGFDNDGYSYSSATLSGSVNFNGLNFGLGPVGAPDAVYGGTITLPAGHFTDLYMLGAMVNNVAAAQTFKVTYTDGSTLTFNQNMSDWFNADGWPGESVVNCAEKRNYSDGSQQADSVCVYGYDINLDSTKTVQSVTLPNNRNIVMLSMDLVASSIPGTYVYSPASGTVEPVGTDTLNVTFTPTDTTDYKTTTASVSLMVSAPVGTIIKPTISWPTPANITYGTALSATQLNAVAMGLGRPTPQVPTDQLNVLSTSTDGTAYGLAGFDGNGNTYSYKQLGNGSVNYVGTTFTLGSPTVPNAISNGAVYTLTTAGNYANIYLIGAATKDGQTKQPFVLNYSSGNPVTQTISLSSWTNPQQYTGETTIATSNYVNTQSGGQNNTKNYLYGYTITADPTRTLVSISVPNNRAVVIMALGFGSGSQVVVPGTYTYTPPAGTVLPVGNNQTLSVQFNPSNTAAYSSASASVLINVVKAVPVITWPTPAAVPAGTVLSSTQLNATASVPGTFVYSPAAGTVLSAGTYTLKVTFTPSDSTDYATATATVQLVVGTTATSITGGTGFQSSECCFFSQPTPYTVTLGGMSAAPTGTVNVTYKGNTLATGTLAQIGSSTNSSASLLVNSLYFLPGNNTVTINYLGDSNYAPSSTTAVIPLRNPAIGANPATVKGSTSTLVIPYGFPVAGAMSFTYNPGNGGITDFTDSGNSTCASGTQEPAGFVCTLSVTFNPKLPGIRKEAIQVNFTPAGGGAAEPILYLYLSGLGSAAQIALNTATQQALNTTLSQPQSLTFNPNDGNTATLYVANSNLGILDTLPSSGGAATNYDSANTANLRYPTDVAYDAFGNLVVSDQVADKVFEFSAASGNPISTVSTSPIKLGTPTGARLDFANNIYIADAGAGTSPVPQIIVVPGQTYDSPVIPSVLLNGSKVSYPQALAVDNTGNNLYIGDGDLNTILQVALGTNTVSTIAIGPCDATVTSCAFNSPAGIAFDPNGDMFVTDSGQRVLMIPANHSASAPTTQLPLTGLNNPTGITLDGSGNVYITDLNTSVIKLLVNAGAVKVGTSATTKITNTGNVNLTITALTFGLGANSFAETDNCLSAAIAPGGSCTITFTNPRTVASDTLTVTSNAYSPSGVKITLTK